MKKRYFLALGVWFSLLNNQACFAEHAKESKRAHLPTDNCDYVPFGKAHTSHAAVLGREESYLSDDGRFRLGKDDNFWWVSRDLQTGRDYSERVHIDAELDTTKMFAFGQQSMVALNENGELFLSRNKNHREGPIDEAPPKNDAVKIVGSVADFRVSKDRNQVVVLNNDGGVEEISLKETGELAGRQTLHSFGKMISGAISEHSVAILTTGKLTLYGSKGETLKTFPTGNYPLSPPPHMAFSQNGEKLGILFSPNKVLLIDPNTGTTKATSLPPDQETESPFKERRLRLFRNGELLQVSGRSGDARLFFSPNNSTSPELKLVEHFHRVGQAMEFSSDGKMFFFLPAPQRGRHPRVIEDFRMECVSKTVVTDPVQTAQAWLTPKAFNPEKDLGKLIYLVKHHPELLDCLQPALLVLDNFSPLTGNWLDKQKRETEAKAKPSTSAAKCSFPKGTEGEWKEQFERLLKRHTADLGGYDEYYWPTTRPIDWGFLPAFSKFIPLLSEEERESLRERIARSVAQELDMLDYRLSTLSPGVARDLANDSLSDFFSVPSENSVEIFLHEGGSPETTVLRVVSTQAANAKGAKAERGGNASGPFKVYITEVPLERQGKHGTAEVRVGKDRYTARVKLAADLNVAQPIDYSEIKPHLLDEKSCKFFSAGSNSVKDGVLYEILDKEKHRKDRVSVVSSKEAALKECQAFKEKIGPGGCSNLEFAGHSAGGCGVAGIFGLAGLDGAMSHPAKEFEALVSCYKSLIPPDKPVIFTSCGGYGKRQTRNMFRLAQLFDRQIIAANGPCSSDGWGAVCQPGWLEVPRPKLDQIEAFEDSELSITKN